MVLFSTSKSTSFFTSNAFKRSKISRKLFGRCNMRQLQLFVKSWLNGLYLVAFVFFGTGLVLVLLPGLKGQIWQIIGGALLDAGLTILVTTISARQSILEQYNKD